MELDNSENHTEILCLLLRLTINRRQRSNMPVLSQRSDTHLQETVCMRNTSLYSDFREDNWCILRNPRDQLLAFYRDRA